jgi:hypothetical protein
MPETAPQKAFDALLAAGREYNLGGTGEPVAIVVVYPDAAFVKAGWTRDREDVATALMDAMKDELGGSGNA